MNDSYYDFHRVAHPVGRLSRIGLWVLMALVFAFKDWIGGPGVAIVVCVLLLVSAIYLRDKTPEAEPNDGLFWRIALGEQLWKAGGAPEETAKSLDLFGKFAVGLALLGVAASAWLGPIGLFATFAYIAVSTVRYRMMAALGASA